MTLNNLNVFFRDNADHIRQISDRKDTSIGFNAFALVSDVYYRENFHSDIIAAILNPHSSHGEGALYLKEFLTFVSEVAEDEGKRDKKKGYFLKLAKKLQALVPTVDDSVEVAREEGRIDVKITASDWTIIVENKINGAYDMDRQIPRYIEKCKDVVAVVYITASAPGFPADNGWKKGDMGMVKPRLVPVIGFSETQSIKNLAENWIGSCVKVTRDPNVKSILRQYSELLRHQSGETMNQDEVKKVMVSMRANKIGYADLLQVLKEMPRVLAKTIVDRFNEHPALETTGTWPDSDKKDVSHGTVAVLTLKEVVLSKGRKKYALETGLDICCETFNSDGITFFVRDNEIGIEPNMLLSFLRKCGFEHIENWDRPVLRIDANWVYAHQEKFLGKIAKILDYLAENRKRMEEIFASVIRKEHKA